MDVYDKLKILTAAAKYDVACTSSGVDRKPEAGGIGSAVACGICHSFAADGRCITLLKILMSNACAYDCKYCANSSANDIPRATFTPREIADLTINFYRRNYIEGLFLSSGVLGTATRTTELMTEALRILREEYRFYGYIHAKVIPGTDKAALDKLGLLCDRMSVNIEFPSSESLSKFAPCKSRESVLEPMGYLKQKISDGHSGRLGCLHDNTVGYGDWQSKGYGGNLPAVTDSFPALTQGKTDIANIPWDAPVNPAREVMPWRKSGPRFAPAGQSTQMIIGASPETDLDILRLTEALYGKYKLKRIFFSAYIPVVENSMLPALGTKPPLLRENRLYQADWLMRVYGFNSSEILDEKNPSFNPYLDPKCNWAVNHPEFFPVEINRAPYDDLLRVPGIGVLSARKILRARRMGSLNFADLKKLGVVLKRAQYFILCSQKPAEGLKINQSAILNALLSKAAIERLSDAGARQISMFEDEVAQEDAVKCLTGQL